MTSAGAVGFVVFVLGGVVDYLVTQPFYSSLLTGASFSGWNPLTYILFVYGIPYVVSAVAIAAIIGAITGAS